MRISKTLFAFVALTLLCSFSLISCGGDDDPELLEVNPSSISLVSTANSTATVSITCNADWAVSSKPDWVNISSTSGKGNTTLTITALSDNSTASPRTGDLVIVSGSLSSIVSVSQVAALESGCEVIISDEVILNTSATFRLNFGPNASYMYAGFFPTSSAGWSDTKIIAELENNGIAMNTEPNMDLTAEDLAESTSYIQCFVAYNENGNRGELIRKRFSTPNSQNAPKANITDVRYSSTTWYWSTKIGATAQEYYMIVYTGEMAALYGYLAAPSDMGMVFKDQVNKLTSYVNSQDWYIDRIAGENDLFIATWAQRDKVWSGVLPIFYGSASNESIAANATVNQINSGRKPKATGTCTPHYAADREKISGQFRLIRK